MDYGKVSVIMGVYNCENTLSKAIDSIVSQTYENWELIICDDCSTDNTYNIAIEYSKRYPKKIIVIRNSQNSKLSFSLNHCLEYTTGKFIARMDGDDISVSTRFEKQVQFLENNKKYDLVGSLMQYFNEKGTGCVVGRMEYPDRFTLRSRMPFHHATIMTYKYVYDKLNGYTVSERTVRSQDYDLWFRFYYEGFSGYNIQEVLYLVREDLSAIKRRTIKVRWNAFKTTRYGFKLLNYPKIWLIRPAFELVVKSLIPSCIMYVYRNIQQKIN